MTQQLSVLLYSQYSPSSKRFLELLKQSPVDFTNTIGLNSLCVDNEEIRKKITDSIHIEIQNVPCILLVYSDGGVEKYDGSNAFRWAEEIMNKYTPPPPPLSQQQYYIQQPSEENDEDYDSPPQQQRKRPHKRPSRSEIETEPIPGAGTAIDDLDSEDDEDYILQKPPISIRSDAGNFEISDDLFGELEEPNRTVNMGIKSSTHIVKGGKADILSVAQDMQKDRDMDFEKNKPAGMAADRR